MSTCDKNRVEVKRDLKLKGKDSACGAVSVTRHHCVPDNKETTFQLLSDEVTTNPQSKNNKFKFRHVIIHS